MNSSTEVYGGEGGKVQAQLADNSHDGILPFTGSDVFLLIVIALVLFAVSYGLYRAAQIRKFAK